MNPSNAGQALPNPTLALKRPDLTSTPEIDELSPADFKKFFYTGISAVVDTPIVKDDRSAIFAVNIDGFIPPVNSKDPYFGLWLKNFFPVQPFLSSQSFVKIRQEVSSIPAQALYLSHRVVAGNIGLGIRVASNTGQAGNLIVSQASGIKRNYYAEPTPYAGLQMLNMTHAPIDYNFASFMLGDLSLNRNISITPIRRDPTIQTDLARKLVYLNATITNEQINVFAGQYLEDWLLFGFLSDVPNQNANQVTFSFFFDFSRVQFYTPMLPVIPTIPVDRERQILLVSKTLETPSIIRELANYLPGSAALKTNDTQPTNDSRPVNKNSIQKVQPKPNYRPAQPVRRGREADSGEFVEPGKDLDVGGLIKAVETIKLK